MIVSLMVAYSKNRVIGKDNKLLWHLSEDLKNFKRITSGHHIIMGRKTYESIGRALPNRINVIITRNTNYHAPGCVVVNSLEKALNVAKESGETEAIITGGGEIYKEALSIIDRAYITEVDCEIEGDTYFPQIDFSKWEVIESIDHPKDEKNEYSWAFKAIEKKLKV